MDGEEEEEEEGIDTEGQVENVGAGITGQLHVEVAWQWQVGRHTTHTHTQYTQ